VSGDVIVALIGLAMALTIILAQGRARQFASRKGMVMALIWLVIFIAAALLFRHFPR
jgi:hypothetical protein